MSTVFSFRVPRELKKKMDKFKGKVKWSKEIREFIERRLEELAREEALEKVDKIIEKLPTLEKGTVSKLVREDRDSH
ncbi:MAG: hypothetical protein ACP6IP_02460 [Candidatus Njordarchaeia archaeon]